MNPFRRRKPTTPTGLPTVGERSPLAVIDAPIDSPATVLYLGNLRTKAPGLAPVPDAALVEVGTHVAALAYAGRYAETWTLLEETLGLDDWTAKTLAREALTTLVPLATRAGGSREA